MARRADLKAEWAARPPTVRAWITFSLVTFLARAFFFEASGDPPLVFAVLVTAVFVWGLWEGYRMAWIFALVGALAPLVSGLMASPQRVLSLPFVFLAVSLVLLIAPSTQEWVRRQEVRRGFGPGGGPPRRRAA